MTSRPFTIIGVLSGLSLSSVVLGTAAVGCSDLAAPCREGNCLGTDGDGAGNPGPGAGGAGGSSGIGGSGAGGSGTGGSMGDGGAGGSSPQSCDPDVATDPVADSCGVFVSTSLGSDSAQAEGTKAKPFATLAKALEKLNATGGDTLYLCAESFSSVPVIPAGISVYGGLECAQGWVLGAGSRATLNGAADEAALRIVGGGSSLLRDLAVVAADAQLAAGNSIALIVEDASVSLERVELKAAAPGEGVTGATEPGMAKNGVAGASGKPGCTSPESVSAAEPPTNNCEDGTKSGGGSGGLGTTMDAYPGLSGWSEPETINPNGGAGQLSTAGSTCEAGKVGLPGAPGLPGDGASGMGSLGGPTGYVGVSGGAGKSNGSPGQGGGGGGGASGKLACTNATFAGPSGGSGGTGGCGGKPGGGGGPGGSSIALVSLNAKLNLKHSTLSTKNGAKGGSGGAGQSGGKGLVGGLPGIGDIGFACAGGAGGNGGFGGPGGGGLGGHSIAIAYLGTAPAVDDATVALNVGVAGSGGPGGFGGDANSGGDGAPGLADKVVSFNPN